MFAGSVVYVLIKYAMEACLCFFWLRRAREGTPAAAPAALRYAGLRLFLGRAVMLLLADTSLQNLPEWTLGLVFLPVLWLEWSVLDLVIAGRGFSRRRLLMGDGQRSNRWRLCGFGVSVIANIAGLLLGVRMSELWV